MGRKLIEDPSNRGVLTLAQVLAKSSQVGMTKIALDLPEDAVFDVMVRAGFGEPPGSGLPGETLGVLTTQDLDKPIGRATLAYGYGVTVTPMQLARCYQTLASGGVRRPVEVLRQTTDLAGVRVFEERHVREVSRMLEQVVSTAGDGAESEGPWISRGRQDRDHPQGLRRRLRRRTARRPVRWFRARGGSEDRAGGRHQRTTRHGNRRRQRRRAGVRADHGAGRCVSSAWFPTNSTHLQPDESRDVGPERSTSCSVAAARPS